VTISRVQVEFIVNFRVLPNSRNGVYAHTNRLKSRNESVNSASHKHSKCPTSNAQSIEDLLSRALLHLNLYGISRSYFFRVLCLCGFGI